MPSNDSITRTIRFNKRDAEAVESLMKAEGITFNAAVHRLISAEKKAEERVHPKISEKSSASPKLNEEIGEMLDISGLPVEKFLSDLTEMMNNGCFDLSGGKLSIIYPSYISDFEEACHDCCVSVEEAMKKAAKALRRGSI